jgi:hypothetical protein
MQSATERRTRVTKTLAPGQHGAIKLARRYGASLVCVRYRVDDKARMRYTTVELTVDAVELTRPTRQGPSRVRGTIRVTDAEMGGMLGNQRTRAIAIGLGARWDDKAKVWHIPARYVQVLAPKRTPEPAARPSKQK